MPVLSCYDSMFEPLPQSSSDTQVYEGPFWQHGSGFEELTSNEVESQFCERPIGMKFQFIELCEGAGGVLKELIRRDIACGLVLDLALSQQFNLADHWELWQVWIGNLLAFAAITCLLVALRFEKFGLGEQPRRSKMTWLEEWRRLLTLGAKEVFLASCMYGSPHQKEFCFVGVNMHVELLRRTCTRDH